LNIEWRFFSHQVSYSILLKERYATNELTRPNLFCCAFGVILKSTETESFVNFIFILSKADAVHDDNTVHKVRITTRDEVKTRWIVTGDCQKSVVAGAVDVICHCTYVPTRVVFF